MPKCAACNTWFMASSGKQLDGRVFCSDKCVYSGQVLQIANSLSPEIVQEHLQLAQAAPCPTCGQQGRPLDVHRAYKITSYLVVTTWKTVPAVECSQCAVKRQLLATGHCLLFGWWGFPWGVLGTPIQVVRNCVAMAKSGSQNPEQFEMLVRMDVARKMLSQRAQLPEFDYSQPGQTDLQA